MPVPAETKQAVETALQKAQELITFLKRKPSPAGSEKTQRAIVKQLENDCANLTLALGEGQLLPIALALVFPTLSARAADELGGWNWDHEPEPRQSYMALLKALIAARGTFDSAKLFPG